MGVIDLIRSHLRDVSCLAASGNVCTCLRPMTGRRSLPPASFPGSALPLACVRATLGTYALHHPRERGRLTTFRALHPHVGWGCLWTPGGSTGASVRRSNSLTCPPCRCGSGAAWWLEPRPRHDASHRGFSALLPPDLSPTMSPCATHVSSVYRVLDTPPLPATHPRFGNRWHHTRLDHIFFRLRLAVKLATSCRNNATRQARWAAGARDERTLAAVAVG